MSMNYRNILYLGSSSPRRYELLTRMGIPCEVLTFEMEEFLDQELPPGKLSTALSEQKMQTCLHLYGDSRWIVTADTLISLDEHKLGKPSDRREAAEMLYRMQGRTHQVYTGVTLYSPMEKAFISRWDCTDVSFSPMNDQEIQKYLETEEWKGAAGAYRIQEKGGMFITCLKGTYFNVMGLPINLLYGMLKQLKFSI